MLPAVPVVSVRLRLYSALRPAGADLPLQNMAKVANRTMQQCGDEHMYSHTEQQCKAMQGQAASKDGKERSQQRSSHLSPEFASVPQPALYNFLHQCNADPRMRMQKRRGVMLKFGF